MTIKQIVSPNSNPIVIQKQYHAGSRFNIPKLSSDGDFIKFESGEDLVLQTASGWSGIMPADNANITIRYYQKTATIDNSKWRTYVNQSGDEVSTPLRSSKTFRRDRTYSSVRELPSSAKRIDDGRTSCCIYFWKNGVDSYWWSDADVVYAPSNSWWLFYDCSQLEVIDVADWDTSKTTNMYRMFMGCSSVTDLDVSTWNTSKVVNMENMFNGCSNLISLDVSGWDTHSVTNMASMFVNCNSLSLLDTSGWDTSNVVYMIGTFYNCSSLISLDLSGWSIPKVTNMSKMFMGCSNLTTIYAGDDWNTDHVTTSTNMFSGCVNLVGGSNTAYSSSYNDKTYARVDNPPDSPGYFTYKATSMQP